MKRWSYFLIWILLLLFFSCTPSESGKPASPQAATDLKGSATKEVAGKGSQASGWEKEWQDLILAAKKEGRISIISTAGGEPRIAMTNAMKEKFGLEMDFVSGRGAEVSQMLLSQRRAGLYLTDIYLGGTTTPLTQIKPTGAMEPLEKYLFHPEVLDKKAWWGGDLIFVDKDKTLLAFVLFPSPSIASNSELVREEEVKSYKDLLNTRWKGKIIMNDPTLTGTGLKWFSMMGLKIMSWDYLRELAKQEPAIVRDQRLQVDWLARGKYAIGLTLQGEQFNEFVNAGAPLKYIHPTEGSYLSSSSSNMSIINKAPHPSAAKLFANWILTREGQIMYQKASAYHSGRLDIPLDGIETARLRLPGVKYFNSESEDLILKAPEHANIAREIFGPLIK